MEINDLLLLFGTLLAWLVSVLVTPMLAVWLTFPVLVFVSWLVVKAMLES